MKTITICSSSHFYREVLHIKQQLEKAGYEVRIPATAQKMHETGDFNVGNYKTWFGDKDDYHKKTALMRGHFDEVEKGDAVLVINNEKNGKKNYIGGNVLMEMTVAFYLHKPIYVLNALPAQSPYLEEIMGLNPIALEGNLEKLK